MTVKIEFHNKNISFTTKISYSFVSKDNTVTIKGSFQGLSRIDQDPIFYFDISKLRNIPFNISDFTYLGNAIKSTEIIQVTNDYSYEQVYKNRDALIEYMVNKYNITDYDLKTEGFAEKFIRDLKIDEILNKNK